MLWFPALLDGPGVRALLPGALAALDPKDVESLRACGAAAHRAGRKIGICGQAPSDYPEIAERLVRAGIDSLSLSTDASIATRLRVAELEERLAAGA